MRRLAGMAALVLVTLLGVALVWRLRPVILLFAFSLAIAAALRPLVDRQVGRGWSRPLSLGLVYGLAVGLAFVVVWSLGPALLRELRQLADSFVYRYDRIYVEWPSGPVFQQSVVKWLPAPADLYAALAGPRGEALLQQFLGLTASLAGGLSQLVIVLFLSLYWGIDQARFERLWLSLLPADRRARAREIWRAIETGVGDYLRSEVAQSVVAGFLLGLGYWLLGLPYPVLLALASALAWLIPWLGAGLALLPVVIVGLAAGPAQVLLAVAYTLLVFGFLEFVVERRMQLARRQYNALVLVLVVLALGEEFGLAGVLLGPPVAAALQILVSHLVTPGSTPAEEPAAVQFDVYEDRLSSVRQALAQSPGPATPQVLSLIERLDQLIAATGEKLRQEGQLPADWVHPDRGPLAPFSSGAPLAGSSSPTPPRPAPGQ